MLIRLSQYKNLLKFLRASIFCLILFPISNVVSAQYEDVLYRGNFICGLSFGGNTSSISGLDKTILSEPFFINYSLDTRKRKGFSASAFINYRGALSNHLGGQFEVAYSQQGSDLDFQNYQTDFNYKIQFKYQYLNVNALLKFYPFDYGTGNLIYDIISGFNAAVGICLGMNTTPSNIFYTSGGTGNSPLFGTDLEQQQQLRNVLNGKSNIAYCVGGGIEIKHITIDFRYFHGLNDVVETRANSYNFIENKNSTKTFQATIGYYISIE